MICRVVAKYHDNNNNHCSDRNKPTTDEVEEHEFNGAKHMQLAAGTT